jgi:F0F1-type ATP synthase assembly protein I
VRDHVACPAISRACPAISRACPAISRACPSKLERAKWGFSLLWGQFFSKALTMGSLSCIMAAPLSISMSQDAKYYRLAGKIFADFSGSIAVPAVLAALLGKWLDERYATEPRYLILLLFVALVGTAILVVKKAKHYKTEYERLNSST